MIKACSQISLAALAFLFIFTPNASAITIVTHFIGGTPPANAVGGGSLPDIMNTAARMWESTYADETTITLHYGWATLDDAGTHTLIEQGENPNRELVGLILFDNSGAAPFYMDPSPSFNEEYKRRTEEYQELGSDFINVARIYLNPVGDADGRIDLLSVALHEIGHALGLCAANSSFIAQINNGGITITNDLPFAGTVAPLSYNHSGYIPHFDSSIIAYGSVMAGINGGERRIPSELDIVTNAQISGFTIDSLSPHQAAQAGGTGIIDGRKTGIDRGFSNSPGPDPAGNYRWKDLRR